MPAPDAYKLLAKYYDRLFPVQSAWFQRIRSEILACILPEIDSVCDLACGTGSAALSMAQHGTRVFALDLSAEMCRIARQKARAARLPIRVIQADMRSFHLPESVDLVTCEFDALNHVARKTDLARVAKCVSRALRPGGHFYFDVNNRTAFEALQRNTQFIDGTGLALVKQGGYDPVRDKGWVDLELFIREGRCWRRRRAHVEEVCWTSSEIRRALQTAGFDKVRAWDAGKFVNGPAVPSGHGTFYLARKRTS